jgi:membrane-associated phospholipid phosphatase
VLILGYAAVRSLGDHLLPVHDPASIERALFGGISPHALQSALYSPDRRWLDYAGFLLYSGWFFLPLGFGLIVTVFERQRLMEYLAWLVTASYLSDVLFILFPTKPPWMDGSASRILLQRSFVHYTELDNNPLAAFPSLHAGLPLVIGLFFLLRCTRTRWLGWIAVLMSAFIGFDVVYLGEHWLVDVVAGYALAATVAYLFISSHLRAALHRLPGDPLGRLIAFNDASSAMTAATRDLEPVERDRAA